MVHEVAADLVAGVRDRARHEQDLDGLDRVDEIGEMNATMQVKLLRVLQDRRFRRLGGTEEVQADIRIVAATNQDLAKLVGEGKFREDLYYRINVIEIHLPPLRERREDIPLLAEHFLPKFAEQMGKPVMSISQDAQALLSGLRLAGQRARAAERHRARRGARAVAGRSCPSRCPRIYAQAVPIGQAAAATAESGLPDLAEGFDLEARGEAFYRHYLALALERAGGVQVKAAEMLGMSFRSFRYYAKKSKLRDGDE